ncbi:tetratricopeptide repeat protein [Desulfitobacterium sp. AusDCA]|uniref:tetratricopeptide repeat protein n=1 Tax=Desulfitobacterium sp. AusDCA TaxID=3240383 RepID=UPI003DA71A81
MDEDVLMEWRSLMEKGTAFLGEGNYASAEKIYLRSLKLTEQLSVPEISAFNIRLLSTSRIKQGKVDLSEIGFQEALEICKQIDNYKGMSEAMAGLASVAVARENFKEAVSWYEQAIKIYPGSSPRLRLSMLYSDLGQVYMAAENWAKAKSSFLKARELCHSYGFKKGEGELSILLGEVAYRQKDVDLARKNLIHAGKIFSEIQDEESFVNAIQYWAFIDFELGNLEKARESWHRVIALHLRLQQKEELSESMYFLAKILHDLKDISNAIYYLELSIDNYPGKDLGLALRYETLAQLLELKPDYPSARDYLKKAAEILEQNEENQKLGEVYEKIALYSERLGETEEALIYHTESRKYLESHQLLSLNMSQRLAHYFENQRSYLYALQYYWECLRIAREIGMDTLELEQAIQRVSKKVRKK